jgi:hypothetical protein
MATNINITQITPPRVPIVDERTGAVSREWYRWFFNLYNITGGGLGITPVINGGTGLNTIPTNGQLLIGNGTGYTLNTLGTGAGISVTNGAGTITLANTGVLSFSGGTTGLTPATATTGAVTLAGTLIAVNGGTGFGSYAVGDLLYADTTTTLAKLPDVATGNALISGGVITAPTWGKIGLTTHVSGILPIANGGTNASTAPTAGAVAYGTGTAYGFTAAGTAGQVLTSNGAGVPTWTTNAGGDVTGPASSTDNAIARFDGTTGKLIQNSVTTIDDTGAATGFTTFAASTSVTTPIVQASNSAGLSLKNASGTTQMSVGAGGGDNMSINVSTNLNGANAQIDISPTGSGHVHIKPSGTGSIEVAPTNVGTIDNMTIGATTPKNGSFVDLSVTGITSFDGSQGTAGQVLTSAGTGATPTWTTPTTGTVTSVSFTGGIITVANPTTTPALTVAGTSGGIPYFSSASTWATSAALTANALMVGGGAGAAPSTIPTGTDVVTALGVNTGTAGAFVVNGGALGTPSSGTVTNLTGTASININGTVGATTPAAGTFTSLSDSGNLTFTSTANRITGDMSNATAASRVLIQTSTVNGQTATGIMPNGTGTQAQWAVYNSSDPANSSQGRILITSTLLSFQNLASGTGTSLPMAFFTGGSERVRIEAGGNVGIGTTAPNASAILDVQSTTKGVRFPNMTTVQKNAIGTPAAGLVVFDTTLAKLCVYSGAAWQTITSI